MRLWPCALAIGVAVASAAVASAQPARAGPNAPLLPGAPKPLSQSLTGEAKAAYDAAKLLLGDGDFAGAAIKFRGAYDQSGDARLLWNIAACEKNRRHYAKTMALVREYLDTGKDLLTDADRREGRALLDAIESFTVRLTVVVKEPGAEIDVDDERVGTSPLEGPVTVDIGQRKITVKKAGFRDATQQLPVGGSTAARVEITLEPDVHDGRLTVTSQPDAHIAIDGKVVANGRFEGKLRSGAHTLRVEADGMRPYQSEVVLADDENRSVDVPLERLVLQQAAAPTGPGLELGLSGGPGVKLRGDQPWMNTVRLDVGLRLGWPVKLGFYAEYGVIEASGACGTDAHGPTPTQPLDLSVRNSFQSCTFAKAGLELAIHFLPAHAIDPWIAVEPGARMTFYDFTSFDPLSATTARTSSALPALDVGGRVGVDWHPARSFRPWALGLYGALVYTVIADENPATNAGNDTTAPPAVHNGGINPVQYFSFFFGLRTSLTF
jgi:hypothetical protein